MCVVLGTASTIAQADEPADRGSSAERRSAAEVPHRLHVRAGAASTDSTGRPTICLDVRVVAGLAVEGCGTGQGVIHDEPGEEMAHFRATYAILDRALGRGVLRARGGLGFAEMQIGVDHPGFRFGDPDRERGSVAGPEASVSAQWLAPLHFGVDFVLTATAGLAYFAGAAQLAPSKSELQGFGSVEAGIGW